MRVASATARCDASRARPRVRAERARATAGARTRAIDARARDGAFDPLELFEDDGARVNDARGVASRGSVAVMSGAVWASTVGVADVARAQGAAIDPWTTFSPVCPASDGVFRVGQRAAIALAGDENIENYRPLINDVLIRVRTELCVLESFLRETAVPFVQEKGVGWVLPARETSETYLAGVVFMIGANFILLGSTKVVAIMAIYHDLSLGLATRLMGSALGALGPQNEREKREKELNKVMDAQMNELRKVMTNMNISEEDRSTKTQEINASYASKLTMLRSQQVDSAKRDDDVGLSKARKLAGAVAVPLKVYGTVSSKGRQVLEVFDTFCSRYFVAFTVTYVIIKTLHYTVFKEFP